MFWLFMYALISGAGMSSSEISVVTEQKAYKKAIDDSVRLEAVLEIRKETITREKVFSDDLTRYYAELADAVKEPSAQQEKIEAVLRELDLTRQAHQAASLDALFELRGKMTRAEWKRVYGKL